MKNQSQNQGDEGTELSGPSTESPLTALPCWVTTDRAERLEAANDMLRSIASCGRRFFAYEDRVSRFDLDERGRLWLTDKYTQKRIYVAYKGRWRGFSDGGTLQALIGHLRLFITQGIQLRPQVLGPWPEWVCGGDLWGYGEDMAKVRKSAQRLGITAAAARDAETTT